MQRDVKVGLILGVILVAVVAVVFFRRDGSERDRFAELLPPPDQLAGRARDAIGPSSSDPYPVSPEYLARSWQSSPKAAGTPAPARKPAAPPTSEPKSADGTRSSSVILQPPEFGPPRPTAPAKRDTTTSLGHPKTPDLSTDACHGQYYTIQPSDTLSDIAARLLGDASLYPFIYDANREVLPDRDHLPVGQKIRIPDLGRVAAAGQMQPESTRTTHETPAGGGGTYKVRDNDSLIDIARRFYHDPSMYHAVFEANRDQLHTYDDLRPGMVLRLP